ncbi:MAG: sodium:calcium antiporter [Candidatus Micrarchaeota archaeon]|nr:sodium:calcium antiporter [Candidatus Micrarchaeota archaeon]
MALIEFLTLITFVIVLAKSSELVVDNAAKLATFFKIRQLAVGMLLVAVSTSLPELSVSVISSVAKQGDIAAGNVFGSNIANILLILGTGAVLYGFKVGKESLADIALVLMLTTVISVYILFHSQFATEGTALGFYEGILLLVAAGWYSMHLLKKKKIDREMDEKISRKEGLVAFILFFISVLAVLISASFVVDSAVKLANILGLAKSFIGATLIAIGTSLPELSIDLQAMRKRHYGLAIGDAIGSNMINLTLVLGTAAVLSPILVQLQVFIAALLFAIIANAVFMYIVVVKGEFKRNEGALMMILYIVYILVIFTLQIGEIGQSA